MRKLSLLLLPLMILCFTTFCGGRTSELTADCKSRCIGKGRVDIKKCKSADQACKTGVVGKLRGLYESL